MATSVKTAMDVLSIIVDEVGLETTGRILERLDGVAGNASFRETVRMLRELYSAHPGVKNFPPKNPDM